MADAIISSYSPPSPFPNSFRKKVSASDISVDPGAPVTPSGPDIIFAKADAAGTANVAGLANTAGEAPGYVDIQYAGPMTLTPEQWDARVTGESGGLTEGAVYYLSEITAGKITTTATTGANFITPIGFALSSTTMMLQIGIAVVASA